VVCAERSEYRIGDIAYAGLQRQELRGDPSGTHFRNQKLSDVVPDLLGDRSRRAERSAFIREVRFDDADDFGGLHCRQRRADAVGNTVDRNFAAVRRIVRLVDIMHSQQRGRMPVVQFDQNLLGFRKKSGSGAHRCREDDASAGRHVAGLNHGPVHGPEEAVADYLRQHRKVHIDEARAAGIDPRPQVRIRLVRRTETDSIRARQRAIQRWSCRCSRQDSNLKLTPGGVFCFCFLGKGGGNCFGCSGGSEAAETYRLPVLNMTSCFFGGKKRKRR
jgi:hypothetical protein